MEHLVFQPKNHQNLVEFSYITWFKYLRDQNQVYLTVLNIVNCKYEVSFSTLFPFIGFSQNIFTTDYPSQSDIKVFVVDYESQCDLKVFKVDYKSESKGNEGLWYFVKYPSQSDKKICFGITHHNPI